MATQTNLDLGFPLRLFSVGCEPKPKKSINYHSKTEFLEDVENAVGKEVWDNIRDSPLGVIVRFVDNKFTWSSKVVEYLLAKQLVCKKKHEIWCLFGDKPARFSLSEFEDITALNCAPFPEDSDVVEETKLHKELWKKMKIKGKNPCKNDLKRVCENVATWPPEDKTRFAYLSIVSVIIGYDDKKGLILK